APGLAADGRHRRRCPRLLRARLCGGAGRRLRGRHGARVDIRGGRRTRPRGRCPVPPRTVGDGRRATAAQFPGGRMSFTVYPAIDVREGPVVRLAQGDYARESRYPADPLAQALAYAGRGARWLRLVHLSCAHALCFTPAPAPT